MHISVKYSSRLDLPTLKGNEGHRKTICLIGTECKVSNDFSSSRYCGNTVLKRKLASAGAPA
jgi:hypothetical protein